jgi:hypothetical protein
VVILLHKVRSNVEGCNLVKGSEMELNCTKEGNHYSCDMRAKNDNDKKNEQNKKWEKRFVEYE